MVSEARPVVAEVVRGGFVEGHHHGAVAALAADGSVEWEIGDAGADFLPRSCVKPLQALAMVRTGLDLPRELLAIVCASHSGEQQHATAVRRVLARAGLAEYALQCPPAFPKDERARVDWIRRGGERVPVLMNCSGKHAGMLATCVVNGWDTGSYLDPGHPLQQRIVATIEELTGVPVAARTTDGCGAPLLSTSLAGLATGFRRVALAGEGPEQAVASAIREHPELVSGTRRAEVARQRAIRGAIGKSGAEGCDVVALPDGRAFAVKIDDGAGRARTVVMTAVLQHCGVLDQPGVDGEAVRDAGRRVLSGGGETVGEVRAVLAAEPFR